MTRCHGGYNQSLPVLTFNRSAPLLLVLGALTLFGCSKTPSVPAAAAAAPAPAKRDVHKVAGKVLTSDGVLAIVMLKPRERDDAPPPAAADPVAPLPEAVLDQVAKSFQPELIWARAGGPVLFRNSDAYLHNVNVRNDVTHEQAFNVAIPSGAVFRFTFAKEGIYYVTCDIHPEMMAWIVAAPSPYATQTSADGSFSFADVPAGSYVLSAYVDREQVDREVEVAGSDVALTVDATARRGRDGS